MSTRNRSYFSDCRCFLCDDIMLPGIMLTDTKFSGPPGVFTWREENTRTQAQPVSHSPMQDVVKSLRNDSLLLLLTECQ